MFDKPTICFCGSPMIKKGYGKYPYPCRAQDKHPQAMIYQGCTAGHTGWTVDLKDEQIKGELQLRYTIEKR